MATLIEMFEANDWKSVCIDAGYDTLTIVPVTQLVDRIRKPEDVEYYLVKGASYNCEGGETLAEIQDILDNYGLYVAQSRTAKKEIPNKLANIFKKYLGQEDTPEYDMALECFADHFRDLYGFKPHIVRGTGVNFAIYDNEGFHLCSYYEGI